MRDQKNIAGAILYAIFFVIIVPWFLIIWADYTEGWITYPPIFSVNGGYILMGAGTLLIVWAMAALKRYGKGLPMNAYPPPIFVKQGPYRIFHHPVYVGFSLLMTGYFIYKGSSSGLWLVTPICILSMTALVWGYETKDLEKRFPGKKLSTIIDLTTSEDKTIPTKDRIMTFMIILMALAVFNILTLILPQNTVPLWGTTWHWDLITQTPLLSYSGLIFLIWVCSTIQNVDSIRNLRRQSLMALGLALYLTLLYPGLGLQTSMPELAEEITTMWSLPAFMIFITIWQYRKTGLWKLLITGILGITILIYQFTQVPSAPLHLSVSFVIFVMAVYDKSLWRVLKNEAQWVANSWKEWRIGKVRVINHGFYVGFAAFFGILLAGVLAGPGYAWGLLVFAITVVVFSALWAQAIEGSEKLKRPYGYYGALVGIIFGSGAVWAMGLNGWLIIGVVSVVMPWVQGIGRLRCLINGCCHGHKVEDARIGIRYYHPRSRVCGISNLRGELVHPTPLYAILWLFFIGFILLKLWLNGYSASFIFGLYLILTGIGRFVEEAYRGEVQTAIVGGLRLYQWTAILSVMVGIAMTFIHIPVSAFIPAFYPEALMAAFIGGLFVFVAMGVDFPESNARFSRLV